MRTLPVSYHHVKFNNFKSTPEELKTSENQPDKPNFTNRNNDKKYLLVSAAVAVTSLGVSAFALKKAGNKSVLENTRNEIRTAASEELKTAVEKLETKLTEGLADTKSAVESGINNISSKVEANERKIAQNQKWNDGYLDGLTKKVDEVASRPLTIKSEQVMDRNWAYVDGMRLVQNTDNEGHRKELSPMVREKIRVATSKFINGKDGLNNPTLLATLGTGAVIWLPTAESIPEKEGGLGEVPVQMATNYVKEFGIDTYIPRPLMEIPGKSEIKKTDNKWTYKFNNLTMDVDKVAEYETVAYHNGIPHRERVEVFYGIDPKGGYKRLMFRNPNYFSADGLYAGSVTAEEPERYTFFSRALYDFMKLIKDPKSVPYAKFEHPTQFASIKAPDAMALNDWHVAPVAALMRLLAPVEASEKKLDSSVSDMMEKMNLLYIVHNADYQGHEYHHKEDILNTLFGQYAADIYRSAETGFVQERKDSEGRTYVETISSLRSPLMIDNNVNMANMAMALATKVKPVSPTYSRELAEQDARGKGLRHIAKSRLEAGTMEGQSNGWDRSVNEVSEANLAGFNNNLNKDKLVIFKDKLDRLDLSRQDRAKVDEVIKSYNGGLNLANYKPIIESLGRLNIPQVETALQEMREAGILEIRSFVSATNDMQPEVLKDARLHNKKLFFEHVKSMIDYNKSTGREVFNLKELGFTDLSEIDPEKIDEVPFFNLGVRFVDQKGVDIVSAAWVEILSNWDNWYPNRPRPIINTGGADSSANGKFKNMISNGKQTLGEKGKTWVQWDGFVPNNILMAGSDWTMRPSHFEPDGDKWESLYKGTPMVMTRVGGHIDSIKDGFNGFLTRRTVPEIQAEVARRGLQGEDFENAVLQEKIKDYVEALKKALDAFFDGKAYDDMVLNSINGNQSWVIKGKDGKILSCPSLEHLRDLGFNLKDFPQISESAY